MREKLHFFIIFAPLIGENIINKNNMRMKRFLWLAFLVIATIARAQNEYVITVESKKPSGIIDEMLYGQLFEHIYFSANNGVWQELIQERSFEPEQFPGIHPRDGYFDGWFMDDDMVLHSPTRYEQPLKIDSIETCDFDLTYFVLFQMDCLVESAKELHAHIDREQKEAKEVEDLLRGILNQRQLDLVRHARRHVGYVYTAAEHASWHGVSLNSARMHLEGLRSKGFLDMSKRGKTKVYAYKGN